MRGLRHVVRRFLTEQEGQDIIEYGLLAAFISVIVYLFLMNTGLHVSQMYTSINGSTTAAAGASS